MDHTSLLFLCSYRKQLQGHFSPLKHWIMLMSCLFLLRTERTPRNPPVGWVQFFLLCTEGLHLHQMQTFLNPLLHPLAFLLCDCHKMSPMRCTIKNHMDIMLGKHMCTLCRMLCTWWSGEDAKGMGPRCSPPQKVDAPYHAMIPTHIQTSCLCLPGPAILAIERQRCKPRIAHGCFAL